MVSGHRGFNVVVGMQVVLAVCNDKFYKVAGFEFTDLRADSHNARLLQC